MTLLLRVLKDSRQGIELLTIRSREGVVSLPSMFQTRKLQVLSRESSSTEGKNFKEGSPKNQNLVESISEIRVAVLKRSGTDVPDLLPMQEGYLVEVCYEKRIVLTKCSRDFISTQP